MNGTTVMQAESACAWGFMTCPGEQWDWVFLHEPGGIL